MGTDRILILIALCLTGLLLFASCQTPQTVHENRGREIYNEKIRDWQKRINREGWSAKHVEEVLGQSLGLVTYRMELEDHWATPGEFIQDGFQGDCEDIAFFLMGTLKRLDYPYRIRIMAVKGTFSGHALLKVEMPEGVWMIYETTAPFLTHVNPNRVHVFVEFDDKEIFYPPVNERMAKVAN